MTLIPFTQYMRPSGNPMPLSIDRPDDIANRAFAVIEAGYNFAVEHLSTGEVSLTIEDAHGDHGIKVVPNKPGELAKGVDALVMGFKVPAKAVA